MSKYVNDPRVQRVSETRFELPSPEGWFVERTESGRWKADAANESYTPHYADTADEAIATFIGEPQ